MQRLSVTKVDRAEVAPMQEFIVNAEATLKRLTKDKENPKEVRIFFFVENLKESVFFFVAGSPTFLPCGAFQRGAIFLLLLLLRTPKGGAFVGCGGEMHPRPSPFLRADI